MILFAVFMLFAVICCLYVVCCCLLYIVCCLYVDIVCCLYAWKHCFHKFSRWSWRSLKFQKHYVGVISLALHIYFLRQANNLSINYKSRIEGSRWNDLCEVIHWLEGRVEPNIYLCHSIQYLLSFVNWKRKKKVGRIQS